MRVSVATVVAVVVGSAGSLGTASTAIAVTAASYGIAVNANGSGRIFDGVGAILGGGDNNRYLADYPERQRTQILDDLFKPDYGASLELLKIEIGGDDGGEATVEPANGQINCNAGYGLSIAKQAVAINPGLRLYGLQWSAPSWVDYGPTVFTAGDIKYLMDWMGCARRYGLHVSYLGGWNESDNGLHTGYVYTLSTTTGQTRRAAARTSIPAPVSLTLPYDNSLATSANAGSDDDETSLLAGIYGAFEIRPCVIAHGSNTTCTEQTTTQRPVLWQPQTALSNYFPYALLGDASWSNYIVSSDVLFNQNGNSAGLIARFTDRANSASTLAGYIFDVNDTGAWAIYRGNKDTGLTTLASGQVAPLSPTSWHKLSLTTTGNVITAAIDGTVVGSATDDTYQTGPVGLEAGLSSRNWPQVQYSSLTVTPVGATG